MKRNPNQAFIDELFAKCPRCGGSLVTIGEKEGFGSIEPSIFGGSVFKTKTIRTKKCTRCGYIIEK